MYLPRDIIEEILNNSSKLTKICFKLANKISLTEREKASATKLAIQEKSVKLLKYFHSRGFPLVKNAPILAIQVNSLSCLKYCKKYFLLNADAIAAAIENDNLTMLKFLNESNASWNYWVYKFKLKAETPNNIQFLREKARLSDASWPCVTAASFNSINCLRYLHEIGVELNIRVFLTAKQNQDYNCLKFLYDKSCPTY